MKFYFYLSSSNEINEVTNVYSQVIEDAIKQLGHSVIRTHSLRDIPKRSAVITILDKDCALLHMLKRPLLSISWYQGIIPEEAMLTFKGHWSAYFRKIFHEQLEKYTLRRNAINIFVSNAQELHYKQKYNISSKCSFIMPCYNTIISRDAFFAEKYESPSFVYAGGMAAWQCVPIMLELFKDIKKIIPSSTLTIFTSQQEVAKEFVNKIGVDAKIEYCNPEMLNVRLREFKYGFLIRDNIKVNQVATPTKINTYMAAGLIPIYTDVIEDYRVHISQNNPFVISGLSKADLTTSILDFEKLKISSNEIYECYKRIFDEYWNANKYQLIFKSILADIISGFELK